MCSFHIDFLGYKHTKVELTTMEMQQFLPLPPQYKISVNTRVEEATANTLDHH